jgi:hypothetical protein
MDGMVVYLAFPDEIQSFCATDDPMANNPVQEE